MRSWLLIGAGAVGLLGLAGCPAHYSVLNHPDDSERIEDAMRPPKPGEVLPEPISLGDEAPPLAPETGYPPFTPFGYGAYGYAPGFFGSSELGLVPGVPGAGPGFNEPGALQPGIKARPGGSIPGLLP